MKHSHFQFTFIVHILALAGLVRSVATTFMQSNLKYIQSNEEIHLNQGIFQNQSKKNIVYPDVSIRVRFYSFCRRPSNNLRRVKTNKLSHSILKQRSFYGCPLVRVDSQAVIHSYTI